MSKFGLFPYVPCIGCSQQKHPMSSGGGQKRVGGKSGGKLPPRTAGVTGAVAKARGIPTSEARGRKASKSADGSKKVRK